MLSRRVCMEAKHMLDFEFGDRRLNDRGSLCLSKIMANPKVSFPNLFREPDELQGFYRFMNNDRAELDSLIEAVERDTHERCNSATSAIAIHDTTQVKPSAKAAQALDDFKYCSGYYAHLSLLVSAENLRHVYGPAALKMWGRRKKVKVKGSSGEG